MKVILKHNSFFLIVFLLFVTFSKLYFLAYLINLQRKDSNSRQNYLKKKEIDKGTLVRLSYMIIVGFFLFQT